MFIVVTYYAQTKVNDFADLLPSLNNFICVNIWKLSLSK